MTLLDEVIGAHGGRRRWGKVSEISAHVRSGGALLRAKLKMRYLGDYGISVRTDRQSVVFEPYGSAGRTGVFEQGDVRVLDADGGVLAEREGAREQFFGLAGLRRKAWWDPLDALYFAGYAMWNYLNAPFFFEWDGFEASEGEPLEGHGQRWRRLDVRFPDGFHTHSPEQSFFYDREGLLRRHDYAPLVVASFARGVHLSFDHRRVDGVVFPTRRRVLPLGPGGRVLPGPPVVTLALDQIALR